MSRTPSPVLWQRKKLVVLGAAAALVGSGFAAANLAGAASGPSAVDYSQCSNGAPDTTPTPDCTWINGVLNANNSQYHEDQVTPQRLLVAFPDTESGSHVHSVTLRYLDRKSTAHAYDYLASANATVTDALTLRCKALPISESDCLALTHGARGTITPDGDNLGPVGSGVSSKISDHMGAISADNRKMDIYGAEFVDTSAATTDPTHDCLSPCTGDDYATTTVSFTTPAGAGTHLVQLLFGGHLAAGLTLSQNGSLDGWGENLGAGSISGGPYHIKWDAADESSVGNRDNQIMSGAIIEIVAQGTSIATTPTPSGTVTIGTTSLTTAHDREDLTVASALHPPTGTASFDLYGPFSSAPTAESDCVNPSTGVTGNRLAHLTSSTWTQVGSTAVFQATSGNVNLTTTTGFQAGKYYQWVAHYDPSTPVYDPYNQASNGLCVDAFERIYIGQATASGASTQTISDTVTVSGFGTPTGTVNWYLYSDSACTTLVASDVNGSAVSPDTDTNNALSSGSATSKGITPSPAAGGATYYWKVVYSGDTNNAPGTVEECNSTTHVQTVNIKNS